MKGRNICSITFDEKYFQFNHNFLNTGDNEQQVLQIVFQSYVHNTRGYCRSVVEAIKEIINRYKLNKYICCWK